MIPNTKHTIQNTNIQKYKIEKLTECKNTKKATNYDLFINYVYTHKQQLQNTKKAIYYLFIIHYIY